MARKHPDLAQRIFQQRAAEFVTDAICGMRLRRASNPAKFTKQWVEDLRAFEEIAGAATPRHHMEGVSKAMAELFPCGEIKTTRNWFEGHHAEFDASLAGAIVNAHACR